MIVNRNSRIYIAGHNGMVGSAIHRRLVQCNYHNLILRTREELDLTDWQSVNSFFEQEKPEVVILAAAKVGGIQANIDSPATFMLNNLSIQNNVIEASYRHGVGKFVFLGSSCIYPRECPQPMKEEYLLTGKLEPTNEGYAIAKIAGIKLLESYRKQYSFNGISLMPCNLYGPGDSFDLRNSHVLSALVRKFVDAKEEVTLWGTGIARREFMHVDDAARGIVFFMEHYDGPRFINLGWGQDISIKELAYLIASKAGYEGKILWDDSKPDGMLLKCMDVTRMRAMGFSPEITLKQGIEQMIDIYSQKV